MPDYPRPEREEPDDLREAFAAEDAFRDLVSQVNERDAGSGASNLFRLVRSGEASWSGLSAGSRVAARQIEKMISEVEFPLPVAAAEPGPIHRRTSGFLLRTQPSADDGSRTWVIVEFPSGYASNARRLVAWLGDEERAEIGLPPARRGVTQAMIENGSVMYRLLCDPRTVVLLG